MITEKPDRVQWEAFVTRHPNGNIFQSPSMYDLYCSVSTYHPGVIALVAEGDVCKGILLYNIIQEPGTKGKFSTRSIIMGGPLVEGDDAGLLAILLSAYCDTIKKTKAIYTQVRNLKQQPQNKEVYARYGFEFIEHLDIWIDLTKDEQQLAREMHKKRYANIKRAAKKNVTIKTLTPHSPLDEVIDLITRTYKRINTPCPPPQLFLNAVRHLKEQVIFVVAEYRQTIIACRVYLLYQGMIYDWYAASDLAYSYVHPNDILPWQQMLWAKANSFHTYDFGGAGHPAKPYGVREYKKRFGGDIKHPGRYLFIHKPVFYAIGKWGMRLLKYLN